MEIKLVLGNGIKKRRKSLRTAQKTVDRKCMEFMEEFVPIAPEYFDASGKLKNSLINPIPGKLLYMDKNARLIYYDTERRKNRGNPGGSRIWFEKTKTKYKTQILAAAQKEIEK